MEEIIIKELTSFTPEIADRIRELAQMIGHNYKELKDEDLQEIIESSNTTLFIAVDHKTNIIAGMITLVVYRIPYVRKAYFDDLVVDEAFRGRGIGTLLLEKIVTTVKEKGAAYLDFSSRPRREAGNSLYTKLGFKLRDTNVYRLLIDYGEV